MGKALKYDKNIPLAHCTYIGGVYNPCNIHYTDTITHFQRLKVTQFLYLFSWYGVYRNP